MDELATMQILSIRRCSISPVTIAKFETKDPILARSHSPSPHRARRDPRAVLVVRSLLVPPLRSHRGAPLSLSPCTAVNDVDQHLSACPYTRHFSVSYVPTLHQLVRELKNGVFGGSSEGMLNFPPTYKYEVNSDKYYGEDPKVGKRSPAWCDRILSYGKGMRLLSYSRAELKLSDHRPVTATYMVEVEAFSPRKLQRALTFTDAEVENEQVITNLSN
ncbi:hypothetical protein VNO78_08321 [Psophocarpus tetragonolobus]|uniref:Inositol polyphosphate-related phosphatase domain-containing protein n=1 Tax=Psophocarpus tetragonolobus TaxID=3891 RepID=A0AAN9SUY2_PSOTE